MKTYYYYSVEKDVKLANKFKAIYEKSTNTKLSDRLPKDDEILNKLKFHLMNMDIVEVAYIMDYILLTYYRLSDDMIELDRLFSSSELSFVKNLCVASSKGKSKHKDIAILNICELPLEEQLQLVYKK